MARHSIALALPLSWLWKAIELARIAHKLGSICQTLEITNLLKKISIFSN